MPSPDGLKKELCIVTPSGRRAWDRTPFVPVRADEAYVGCFSRKCQQYASEFYDTWCILDAFHGFMFPADRIRRPHDRCLYRLETEPITVGELRQQVSSLHLDDYGSIVVLGGRRFIELVEEAFPDKKVRAPLAGRGGIGHMMGALGQALTSGCKL
jgi:hypothetical protein